MNLPMIKRVIDKNHSKLVSWQNIRVCFFILFILTLPLFAQSQNLNQTYTPDQLKSDFHILKTVLEQAHPSLYTYTSKEKWDIIFRETELKLGHDMTQIEFRNVLAPLIYQTHCDHTYIDFDSAGYRYHHEKELQFPFRIKVFNNRIYISKNLSKDTSIQFGAEILRINHIPSKKILKQLLYTESADGYNMTKLRWAVQMEFHDKYSLFIGSSPTYIVDIRQKGSKKIEIHNVAGLTHDSIFRYYKIRYPEAWANRSKPLKNEHRS